MAQFSFIVSTVGEWPLQELEGVLQGVWSLIWSPTSFLADFLLWVGADCGCLYLLEPWAPKLVLLSLPHIWEPGRARSPGPLDLNHPLHPKQPCYSTLS